VGSQSAKPYYARVVKLELKLVACSPTARLKSQTGEHCHELVISDLYVQMQKFTNTWSFRVITIIAKAYSVFPSDNCLIHQMPPSALDCPLSDGRHILRRFRCNQIYE